MKSCYTLALLLSMTQPALAQYQGLVYDRNDSTTVMGYSGQKSMPFCGGFNNPQFALGDLNNDGKKDLVIYERFSYQVKTFINTGSPGNPVYVYAPKYALNFPEVRNYVKLEDYDRDGIPDLMHRLADGVGVYKGYYNAGNELCFNFRQLLQYSNDLSTVPPVDVFVNSNDIPAIVDIDHDGDLDVVSYSALGNNLFFYKNYQVEMGLPADSMMMKLRDKCWGKVSQNTIYRAHILQFSCDADNSTLLPKQTGGLRHGNNGVCLFDNDGDGDYDYLDGNASFADLQFLKNGKAQYGGVDSMISQDTLWQKNGVQAHMPQFPVAWWLDIDQDGNKDILVSPHGESGSENYKCILYYRNTGSAASPVYTYQSDSFLVTQTIDAGTGSYPLLYDYDKDGKPDLIVGSDGFHQANGTLRSRLLYFKNTSTPGHISFAQQSDDFNYIFGLNLAGAAPAVGDLDNDGKDDMVLGQSDGTLTFFSNTATNASQPPQWPIHAQLRDYNNALINAGNSAVPVIYDLNRDGKKDLVIGNQYGRLVYYENTGTTPGQLKLQLKNSQLGNITIDPSYLDAYASPYIGKMDNTGVDYILCGSASGRLYRYDGFQGGNTQVPYPLIDTSYSFIDSAFASYTGYSENISQRSAPAIADIDGDGKYDMILGNVLGGLTIYKQVQDVAVNAGPLFTGSQKNVKAYPNPAGDILYLSWDKSFSDNDILITIYSTAGQKIQQASVKTGCPGTSINVKDLATGVYFCELRSGTNKAVMPLSIYR
ncbi:MAG: T9SS type A sorting domain-containing protein [Bacteroidetes bacterium]|nr:T9SS type A sorting domain-containing protein [Bacteroidota bacterium]